MSQKTLHTCLVNYTYSLDPDVKVKYEKQEGDILLDIFGNISEVRNQNFIIRDINDKDKISIFFYSNGEYIGGNCSNYVLIKRLVKIAKEKLGV